jgi:hypothetical protein
MRDVVEDTRCEDVVTEQAIQVQSVVKVRDRLVGATAVQKCVAEVEMGGGQLPADAESAADGHGFGVWLECLGIAAYASEADLVY